MPLSIVQADITKMQVDAIVNAANPQLLMGGGVCGAIFRASGAAELQAACAALAPIQTGSATITPGFRLPARYLIHAAGPIYRLENEATCEQQLFSAYAESLRLARKHGCDSIAFPLISSGIYGYPKAKALQVAVTAIEHFLAHHKMQVFLALYDREAIALGRKLFAEYCAL